MSTTASSGITDEVLHRIDAERGSARLAEAVWALFERRAAQLAILTDRYVSPSEAGAVVLKPFVAGWDV